MSNGSRRRNRKRRRVRYDRLIALALVLVVLIVIITSCTKSCSDDKDENSSSESSSQSSVVDELTTVPQTTQPDGQQASVNPSDASTQSVQYTTESVPYDQVYKGSLVLVNSLHQYTFPEGDLNLATVYENRNEYYAVKDNIVNLDLNVITQLNALMAAYAQNAGNTDLSVIEGYRTLEEQSDKYNAGTSVFQGGYSDYNSGRTIDLGIFPKGQNSYYYMPEGNYAWLDENAANYGFILRYPKDKDSLTGEEARTYTYRYVGVPHAEYIKSNNLCLEEYIEQIKNYTSQAPLAITSASGQYEVYYVPANVNSPTDVPVPSNKTYTISGNNFDGFIVTVKNS